jgi:hypothetical protein
MSTLSLGFPPSHYAMMNAFIDFKIDHHLELDAKFIEGNFFTPMLKKNDNTLITLG